jgi:hypothetical protein
MSRTVKGSTAQAGKLTTAQVNAFNTKGKTWARN